jgi:hypothetical protein
MGRTSSILESLRTLRMRQPSSDELSDTDTTFNAAYDDDTDDDTNAFKSDQGSANGDPVSPILMLLFQGHPEQASRLYKFYICMLTNVANQYINGSLSRQQRVLFLSK